MFIVDKCGKGFVLGFKFKVIFPSHTLSKKVCTRAEWSATRIICCSLILLKTLQSRLVKKKAVAVSQVTRSE